MYPMKKSKEFLKRAKKVIPALSQTFSKAPYSLVSGVYPSYLSHGKGSHVFDVDGNKYIDYILGLGPISLGYSYPRVNNAVIRQLKKGVTFSLPHFLEVEVSELMSSIIPGADMVRFAKTGSDAGTGAVRAARAITKRDNIAYCGGGGVWHDWFTVITSRNEGIPKKLKKMIRKFDYNNIDSLKILFEDWHGEIATIYMEPMMMEFPKKNFLESTKKIAKKYGAILIFDEVITGFRLSLGGAQEFLKTQADLAVFGKGMANGMPLAAITGKYEYMEKFNDIFYSSTYFGETSSLVAVREVIKEMQEKPVIEKCWKLGKKIMSEFNRISDELEIKIKLEGLPVRSKIVCRDENNNESLLLLSLFCQETLKRGVLFGPGYVFLSYSHSFMDIKKTLKASKEAMIIVKKAIKNNSVKESLKGNPMVPVMTF